MRRLLVSSASPVVVSSAEEEIQQREQSVEQHPEVNSEQQPSVVEEKYKTNRLTEEECKNFIKNWWLMWRKKSHISIPI